jgi:hypothetical protein
MNRRPRAAVLTAAALLALPSPSARAQLVAQGGVGPARLEARGYGETRPLIGGQSDGARAADRRVELRIVDPVLREAGSVR